jgi:plastocyanin
MTPQWRVRALTALFAATAIAASREPAAPPTTAPAATADVAIDNFTFTPAVLEVAAGTTVTWLNRDDVPHTVTSSTKAKELNSGAVDSDGKYQHTFTTPGTYPYYCAVHPHMTAKVVVKPAAR